MAKKILILSSLFLLATASLWQANKDNNLLAKLPGLFYSKQQGNSLANQTPQNESDAISNLAGLLTQLSESENKIKGLQEKITYLEQELETYKHKQESQMIEQGMLISGEIENNQGENPAISNIKICEINDTANASKNKIILNEIAWMGDALSANHEWIELKNISQNEINLEGWQIIGKDNQIEIIFTAENRIPANGFILAERTTDESAPGIKADLIYSGALRNSEDALYLFNGNCLLEDEAQAASNWPSGDNTYKNTMERRANLEWQTSLNPGGTPKAENSPGSIASPKPQQQKASGGGSASSQKAAINLSFAAENPANQEIVVALEALNLKNTEWDIKVSIENEGTVLSETYNYSEEKWQNSFFYIDKAFSGQSFNQELKLKLKNEFKEFEGQASIIARIRENGKSTSHSASKEIYILKAKSENSENDNTEGETTEEEPDTTPEIIPLPNFMLNEFFESWDEPGENANQLHNWEYSGTPSHIKRNDDSLLGQFSAQWTPITAANNLTQNGFSIESDGIYYSSLWIKPIDVNENNYIRISLDIANPATGEFPNASFQDYKLANDWINIAKEANLSPGNQGGLRIRVQRNGSAGPSLLLGAAWFSNTPPPENWLN